MMAGRRPRRSGDFGYHGWSELATLNDDYRVIVVEGGGVVVGRRLGDCGG